METFRYDIQHNIYFYILSIILFLMGTFGTADSNKTDEVSSSNKVSGWEILGSFYSLLLAKKKIVALTLESWSVLAKLLDRCECGAASRVSRQFSSFWPVLDAAQVRVRVRVRVGVRGWVRVRASDWVDLCTSAVP